MNEDGDSDDEGGQAVEQVLYDEARSTSGRMKFGLAKFGLADLVHEMFLWLIRQSKGKDIKASKVLYNMFVINSFDLVVFDTLSLSVLVTDTHCSWASSFSLTETCVTLNILLDSLLFDVL